METNVLKSDFDVATELQDTLRTWAHAQSPETDFGGWRMASLLRPMKLRDGPFFAPGELVLVKQADVEAAALRPGLIKAWSFELAAEVMMHPALVQFETEAPQIAHEPQPEIAAHPGL